MKLFALHVLLTSAAVVDNLLVIALQKRPVFSLHSPSERRATGALDAYSQLACFLSNQV